MIDCGKGEWLNGGWLMFLLINSTADIAFYTISVLSANSSCRMSNNSTNCHVTCVPHTIAQVNRKPIMPTTELQEMSVTFVA